MRALVPLIVLGSLLILAGEWQSRNAGTAGVPRETPRGPGAVVAEAEDGWSLLVLGRPSGAEPLRRPEPTRTVDEPTGTVSPPTPLPVIPSDTRYVVQPNDVLGVICQTHYDVRPLSSVIEAVAAYNDLPSVDSIRSGDVLLLPDPAVLFQGR